MASTVEVSIENLNKLLERSIFRKHCSTLVKRVSKNLMAFAATSPFADQAGKVSADLVINAFRNRVNDVKKYVTPSVTSQTPVNKANEGRIDVPNISGGLGNLQGNQNIPKLMVGELDAIRQILSNGLNVYITGMASSSDERDSVYDSSFSSDSLNSFGSRLGIGIDFFSTQPAAPGRKKKNLFNLSRRKMKSVRGSSGVDIPVNIDQEVISMSDLRNADDYLTAAEMLRSGEARAEDEQDKEKLAISNCRNSRGEQFWHIHLADKVTVYKPKPVDIDELNNDLDSLLIT